MKHFAFINTSNLCNSTKWFILFPDLTEVETEARKLRNLPEATEQGEESWDRSQVTRPDTLPAACSPTEPRRSCDCLDFAGEEQGRDEAAALKSRRQYAVRPGLTMGETDFNTHARPLHGVVQTGVYKDELVKDKARTSAVNTAIRHCARQCNKVRKQKKQHTD